MTWPDTREISSTAAAPSTLPSSTKPAGAACPAPSGGAIPRDVPGASLWADGGRYKASPTTAEWIFYGLAMHQTGGNHLPRSAGAVRASTEVRLTLTSGVPFTYASVFAVPVESWPDGRDTDHELLIRLPGDPQMATIPMTSLCFELPDRAGDYVLEGRVDFADDRGRATYLWVLSVEGWP